MGVTEGPPAVEGIAGKPRDNCGEAICDIGLDPARNSYQPIAQRMKQGNYATADRIDEYLADERFRCRDHLRELEEPHRHILVLVNAAQSTSYSLLGTSSK